jgi:cardiolipin synthase
MLDAIQAATRSIEFLFFVYWYGDIPDRFCDALIRRAREGVRVRVLFDGVGSKPMSTELQRRFEESPVEINVFHPIPHWKFWGTASRTHRKILVIDGERAFTGGVGIADEWGGNAQDPEHFRETQFEFTGPAVAGLRAAFHGNWANAGGRLPDRLDIPLIDESQNTAREGVFAGVLASRGAEECTEVALLFQLLAQQAQRTLDIVTPYFVPGEAFADDLALAAERGVRVRVMTCGEHTDHRLSRWAGHRYFERLLKAGVQILEYDRTLLHTKAVIVDQQLCCVGSPNMNQRSLSLDDEVAVVAFDPMLAGELLHDFESDRTDCRSIALDEWTGRGAWPRLREFFASFLEAQL